MHFRRLSSDQEFSAFADNYRVCVEMRSSHALPVNISLDYMRAAQVTGVFDDSGRMVAGFIVNVAHPLRLVGLIPADRRANHFPPFDASWNDCVEMTGAWRLPEVSSVFMSTQLWPRVVLGALATGKRLALGHGRHRSLVSMYAKVKPTVIYDEQTEGAPPSFLFAITRFGIAALILRMLLVATPHRLLKGRLERGIAAIVGRFRSSK